MSRRSGLNCVICGVGGQGNVLASRLIAQVLLARDEHVKTAETIGMAQRGGSVASHVRGGRLQSPLVPKGCGDCLIAFEPGEAVRCIDYLAPDGTIVVNTQATQPPVAALQGIDYDGPRRSHTCVRCPMSRSSKSMEPPSASRSDRQRCSTSRYSLRLSKAARSASRVMSSRMPYALA